MQQQKYNVDAMYVYTPCKISMNVDNKAIYITENFSHDFDYMTDFISNLEFGKTTMHPGYPFITKVSARGKNYINIVSTDSDFNTSILNSDRIVSVCRLDRELIDKINNAQMGNRKNYVKLYQKFWLDIMFNPQNIEKKRMKPSLYAESPECIIIPNIILNYVDDQILRKIETSNIIGKIPALKDVIFDVYVKPVDYPRLQRLYLDYLNHHDESKLYKLCQELFNQQLKSTYHINYKDDKIGRQFIKINDQIHNFFAKFGYRDNDIRIYTNEQYSNNAWIDMKTQCLDFYAGDRYNFRITANIRQRNMSDLLVMFKYHVDPGAGRYRTIEQNDVIKYGIGNKCLLRPTTMANLNNISSHTSTNSPTNLHAQSLAHIFDDFAVGAKNINKIRNFRIVRIFYQKLSKTMSFCSLSLCIEINGRNYLFNIQPNTISYINRLYRKYGKKTVTKYLHNKNSFTASSISYDNVIINHIYKQDLRYNIEIVDTDIWKCGFDRLTLQNTIEKLSHLHKSDIDRKRLEYIIALDEFTRRIYDIRLTTNYELEQIKKKYYVNSFPVTLSYAFLTIIQCLKRMQSNGSDITYIVDDLAIYFSNIDKSVYFREMMENFDTNYIYMQVNNRDHPFICIKSYSRGHESEGNKSYIIRQVIPIQCQYINQFIEEFKKIIDNNDDKNISDIRIIPLYHNNWEKLIDLYLIGDPSFNINEIKERFVYRIANFFEPDGSFKDIKYILDKFVTQCLNLSYIDLPIFAARYHPFSPIRPGNFDFHIKLTNRTYDPNELLSTFNNDRRIITYAYFSHYIEEYVTYPSYFALEPSMYYQNTWISTLEKAYIDINSEDLEIVMRLHDFFTISRTNADYISQRNDIEKIFKIYFSSDVEASPQIYTDINIDLLNQVSLDSQTKIRLNINNIINSLYNYFTKK